MAKARQVSAQAALEIGGLISEPPSERLIETAFADELAGQHALSAHLGLVDLAHTLTLSERDVIPAEAAAPLVAALLELQCDGTTLAASPAAGDLYTNREVHLLQRTPAARWLGTGRARREALTTAYQLLLRERLCELGIALAGFGHSLIAVGTQHADSLMPDYTYLQAAEPTTFCHYVTGFAAPVLRDLQRLDALYARTNLCPAGCGSSNGSVIYQDRAALARRLGCSGPLEHARDAMWQADLAIEAMGVSVAAAIGLDRLAEDLMIFATAEFGFVKLSPRHARASKIMPQKRNPFALAFVRGLTNRLIGDQTAVAASVRTPSGQMDSRMLAYEAVPAALRAVTEAALLMGEVVTHMSFSGERAESALADRSSCASDLAQRLCVALKLDFRSAHRLVANLIGELEAQGRPLASLQKAELDAACRKLTSRPAPEGLLDAALDPRLGLKARRDIGGAAPEEMRRLVDWFAAALTRHEQWFETARRRHAAAEKALLDEAKNFAGARR